MALKAGTLIDDKYVVLRKLGEGGMAIVYLAEHRFLRTRVAIKVLSSEVANDPVLVKRFMNEARSAAGLEHENVCRVTDVGVLRNGKPYLVMEYLVGQDLESLLEKHPDHRLPLSDAVDIVLEALEAVIVAHDLGIVHRDLKPANLFLAKRSGTPTRVIVLDFGIAKVSRETGAGPRTKSRVLLGSPAFMSPEHVRDARDLDFRADLWSIGVLLYVMTTARYPFEGISLPALFRAIIEAEPRPLRSIDDSALPEEFEAVVMRCLKKRPDERFTSSRELAQALTRFAGERGLEALRRIAQRSESVSSKRVPIFATLPPPPETEPAPGGEESPRNPLSPSRAASPWEMVDEEIAQRREEDPPPRSLSVASVAARTLASRDSMTTAPDPLEVAAFGDSAPSRESEEPPSQGEARDSDELDPPLVVPPATPSRRSLPAPRRASKRRVVTWLVPAVIVVGLLLLQWKFSTGQAPEPKPGTSARAPAGLTSGR